MQNYRTFFLEYKNKLYHMEQTSSDVNAITHPSVSTNESNFSSPAAEKSQVTLGNIKLLKLIPGNTRHSMCNIPLILTSKLPL